MSTKSPDSSFNLKVSIRTKLFLLILATTLVVSAIGSYLIYTTIYHSLLQNLRSELIAATRTAAASIDGDEHKQLQVRGDEDSEIYEAIKKRLKQTKQANPKIRYVYTMVKTSDPNIWKFVVDAEDNPEYMSHLGEEYDVSEFEEMKKAFDGPTADKGLTTDKWGTWLSGYAPIYDSSGRAVAIIGMDMSAKNVNASLAASRKQLFLPMLALLLLPAVLSWLISWRVTNTLKVMIDAAKKIAGGDYDQRVPIKTSDEIGELADALNHMAVKVRTRVGSDECMVMIDSLTDLFNHRYFHERLNVEIKRAERYRREVSLIIIDIDKFARFNKANGHTLGDTVLKNIAQLVNDSIRETDIAARYAGEEFAVILPETDEAGAKAIATAISKAISNYQFETRHNISIPLTVGIGVSSYPLCGNSSQEIIDAAFEALWEAKRIGEGQVISFSSLKTSPKSNFTA